MTTNPSIWRIEGNELVEQPTMKQPEFKGDYFLHYGPQKQYDSHIASLRRYPHNLPDALIGVDLVEGEHFRLQHQEYYSGNYITPSAWMNCTAERYEYVSHNYRRIIALPISQPEQPISEEGKEFKQLLKRYVTDFALMLKEGENIRSMYEHYEKGNRLSIEKLMLLATPSQEAVEERNNFAISFACWALYDPQAQSYLSAGITALGLLEKYLDRPYISTNTNQQ